MAFNARFQTKEGATEYVHALKEGFSIADKTADIIAETAVKFDGKCVNVKFLTAIKERLTEAGLSQAIIVSRSGMTLDLTLRHARFDIDKDFCLWLYDFYEIAVTKENRMDAAKAVEMVDRLKDKIGGILRTHEDALEHWETYMASLEEIRTFLEDKIGQINELFVCEGLTTISNSKWRSFKPKKI